MSYILICNTLGIMLCCLGVTQIIPFLVSIIYNDGMLFPCLVSMLVTFFVGFSLIALFRKETRRTVLPKEAMLLVTLTWFSLSILGALPFVFSGLLSFTDAFFETASAFTTTGSSIITNIEVLPKSILFWRSLMQWLGGMGIVVFSIAIMPFLGKNTLQVFQAEVPGIITDKVKPKLRDTAMFLWKGYLYLSLACIICLIFAGMDFFDAIAHTFATISTGGFSTKNDSIAGFSALIQWILITFMFLSGINFALLFFVNTREGIQKFFMDSETQLYSALVILSTTLIVITLACVTPELFSNIEYFVRTALFQVVSIMTSTGFASINYEVWPAFALQILLLLTFIGGCGGSTAGGLKVIRVLILSKLSTIGFIKRIHPNAVKAIKINSFVVSESILLTVALFFILYITLIASGTLILTAFNVDILTAFSAVLTAISNVGPGLGSVGPADNFSHLPAIVKYVLSFLMIVGRLELYTVLILFYPLFWKN